MPKSAAVKWVIEISGKDFRRLRARRVWGRGQTNGQSLCKDGVNAQKGEK